MWLSKFFFLPVCCLSLSLSVLFFLYNPFSHSVSFNVCLSFTPSLCFSVPLNVSLSPSLSLSVYLCLCLSFPFCLSLSISLSVFISLSVCLSLLSLLSVSLSPLYIISLFFSFSLSSLSLFLSLLNYFQKEESTLKSELVLPNKVFKLQTPFQWIVE